VRRAHGAPSESNYPDLSACSGYPQRVVTIAIVAQVGGGFSNIGGGTAIVSNSTFSGNTAPSLGGGINNGSGTLTLNNSTIYGNSSSRVGGISSSNLSVLDMANNIVAGNVGVDCLKFGPPVNATGPNLVQDGSCSAALSGDPMLAPLADNGGPTMTHALCTGPGEPDAACTGRSPAIDAVNNTACPDVDQRGEPRPVDGDGDGNAVCDIGAYELQVAFFAFEGFFPPVDNPSTVNAAKAGQGIPVKFGLGGDRGLDIFQMGYPKAVQIGCTDGMPTDLVEETVAAGGSGLQYDPATDTYTYVWKTDKQWAGQCRRLSVKLTDGSEHTALFQFK